MSLRVTLMHNPTAGDERHSPEALIAMLADAGQEVRYQSMKEDDWKAALREATELVVVAGGDGTVRKVFRELSGSAVAATLLPLGSANNIARSLGFPSADDIRLARSWLGATRVRFDVGQVESAWGPARFVESMGGGIFGEVLARAESRVHADGEDKVELGLRLLEEVIADAKPAYWKLHLDGDDLSGDLLAVEAMNVSETGPNIPLAPEADPGDGALDVVLVPPDDRGALAGYVEARLRGSFPDPPPFRTQRGRRLEIGFPDGCALHVDDELWPEEEESTSDGTAVVTVGASITVLAPGS